MHWSMLLFYRIFSLQRFASRQDQTNPETWLGSRCPCPTCRLIFVGHSSMKFLSLLQKWIMFHFIGLPSPKVKHYSVNSIHSFFLLYGPTFEIVKMSQCVWLLKTWVTFFPIHRYYPNLWILVLRKFTESTTFQEIISIASIYLRNMHPPYLDFQGQ